MLLIDACSSSKSQVIGAEDLDTLALFKLLFMLDVLLFFRNAQQSCRINYRWVLYEHTKMRLSMRMLCLAVM